MPPEEAVQLAKESGSQGMAWTYNEPAIWVDYVLDCAKVGTKTRENTYCPRDRKLAIQRTVYQTKILAVTKEEKCP